MTGINFGYFDEPYYFSHTEMHPSMSDLLSDDGIVTELPTIRGRVWTGLLKRALEVETDPGQRLINAISKTRPFAATVDGLWAFAEWHEDFGDPDVLRARIADRLGDVLDEFGCAWIQRRRILR